MPYLTAKTNMTILLKNYTQKMVASRLSHPDGDADDDFLTRQESGIQILGMVVDNLDDFYSSIVSRENRLRENVTL